MAGAEETLADRVEMLDDMVRVLGLTPVGVGVGS